VLQFDAVRCSVYCSVLQCVAKGQDLRDSVLQCVAVCCCEHGFSICDFIEEIILLSFEIFPPGDQRHQFVLSECS